MQNKHSFWCPNFGRGYIVHFTLTSHLGSWQSVIQGLANFSCCLCRLINQQEKNYLWCKIFPSQPTARQSRLYQQLPVFEAASSHDWSSKVFGRRSKKRHMCEQLCAAGPIGRRWRWEQEHFSSSTLSPIWRPSGLESNDHQGQNPTDTRARKAAVLSNS